MKSKLAEEIEELVLIISDLRTSIECIQQWAALSKEDGTPENILNSLFRNGIVTFMACFDDATPYNLDSTVVYSQLDGGIEYFKWLKTMRDTWIAHRSGPMRQAQFGFIIDPNSGEIEATGYLCHTEQIKDADVSDSLLRFIGTAGEHATRKMDALIVDIRSECEALYPSQRKALPDAKSVIPSYDLRAMGRRKFRNVSATEEG